MSDIRIKRVESLIREEISKMIMKGVIKHPSVNNLISITNINVSGDLSHAKIFISSFESHGKAMKAVAGLNRATGFIQGKLGKKLHMRTIPKLEFVFDDSIEQGFAVNKLIDSVTHDEE
ncbi:MAG: ribosome-binding factor A [Spirochaetaceae bacterium 4572_7]|nr:MAG: ribosome-binding factor A [Spirochaetaceae bacterium 4572_7]